MKKLNFSLLLIFLSLFISDYNVFAEKTNTNVKTLKPRIVVLTDIAPVDIEPDDMESMIRLLSHADLYEIEALITTSGWNSSGKKYPHSWNDSLQSVINAYKKICQI